MSRLLDYVVQGVLLAIFSAIFAGAGFIYLSLTEFGPSVVFWSALGGSAAVVVLCYLVGYMVFDMESERPRTLALIYALVTLVLHVWIPADMLYEGHAERVYLETNAPLARDYAVSHFDQLDVAHTGTLTTDSLKAAEADPSITPEHRALIELLRAQIDLAGHVTGSYTTQVPITNYISCGTNCQIPVTTYVDSTTYSYGISRGDLPAFPERIHAKWAQW